MRLFDFGDDFMGDGIERKSRNGFDAELGRDVFAMSQDGIEADKEPCGNFFVRISADDESEHFLFTVREMAVIVDHREQDAVANAVVLPDVAPQCVDGEQNGITQVLVVHSGQMLDYDVPHIVHHGFDRFVGIDRSFRPCISPVLLFFAERKELGKPFFLVGLNASAQFLSERSEDIAQQLQRSIAPARRMNKYLQVPVDVGQLVLQIISKNLYNSDEKYILIMEIAENGNIRCINLIVKGRKVFDASGKCVDFGDAYPTVTEYGKIMITKQFINAWLE